MARLKDQYEKVIKPELLKESRFESSMSVPALTKIVLNVGVGEATTNSGAIEEVAEILELITGQKPVVAKSRIAVSSFKLRQGMDIGVYVTLRGEKMWEFFDKLVNVVLPRTKDFQGLSEKAFDGAGNYSLGVEEHTVFPEIDPNRVAKLRSLQINIVTTASNNEDARLLLDKFGFPFRKHGKKE